MNGQLTDERLIERVAKHVRGHYRNHPLADDIEQVARIRAWRTLPKSSPSRQGRFTYLCIAAEREAYRWLVHAAIIRVPLVQYRKGVRRPVDQLLD